MLKRFSVENFKGFKDKITFELGNPCNYSFHPETVEENCITRRLLIWERRWQKDRDGMQHGSCRNI